MSRPRAFAAAALAACAGLGPAVAGATDWGEDSFRVGGFVALDSEAHGHPDRDWEQLLEINKLRLNFDLQMSDDFSILAEYNPVPEELVHAHDALPLKDGRTLTVARLHPEAEPEEEEEGLLPFERIEARWTRIGGRSLNLSAGQLRNPFGLWEDLTAHRNSTATKNNALVLGIALHNVDIGAQVDGTIGGRHRFVLGVRNGATIRTQAPRREDDDGEKDLVGKFVTRIGGASVGASAYLVGGRADRWALGGESILPVGDRSTISGELVYQASRPEDLSSLSGYVQASRDLYGRLPGLRAFALIDYWRLEADGVLQGEFVSGFAGLKYRALARGVTLTAEYGRIDLDPLADDSHHMINLQAEVSF